jgi:hypothetical protein
MAYKITVHPNNGDKQVKIDIETVKGDSLEVPNFVAITYDGMDFTDATISMQCRNSSGRLLHTFSPLTVIDSGNFVISLDEPPLNLPVGTHRYDIQINFVGGKVDTRIYGDFIVTKEYSYL